VLKKFSPQDKTEFKGAYAKHCRVDTEKCIGCKSCLRVGCPAIFFDKNSQKAIIGSDCVGCEVCAQVCPKQAIQKEEA
jgi:indolepyruvate ferredoxin oxidoreductase, alpha subunit